MYDLNERYEALRAENRHLRARDAARVLGTTEAALVSLGVTGPATTLRPDWAALFAALPRLSGVMALTRNDHAIHERHGAYLDVTTGPGHILVLGPDIDLRLFPSRWRHAYVLGGQRPSVQIFDEDGEAAHKIFAVPGKTDMDAWAHLTREFALTDATPPPTASPIPAPVAVENEVDAAALRADWLGLRDTHDFVTLLRKHKASRRQALRLVGTDLALPLDSVAAASALKLAAECGAPIMIFVGNRSAIQIHTGPVRRVLPSPGGWFNVLDPEFNLHLREAGVTEAWWVVKPTEDGAVTSIELLDAEGGVVAQLFGARKPGRPELAAWRDIASTVAEQHALKVAAA